MGLTRKDRIRQAVRRVVRTVRRNNTFFLAGHKKPDGDTLGCALAFASVLKRLGKRARVYSADPVPQMLSFMPGADSIIEGRKAGGVFDVAILLECSTADRMGKLIDLKKQAGQVVHIDHHKISASYGDVNLIDPRAASNAEQVWEVLHMLTPGLTRNEAICLYVGVVTDTGRFMYASTTPDTHRLAARLLEYGVPGTTINERLFAKRPHPALRLLSRCLQNLRVKSGGKVAVMKAAMSDFRNAGASPEHTEEIVNYGMMIPGIAVSVLLKKEEGHIFASLRSNDSVDVSRVAEAFGGGGHRRSAGCRLKCSMEEAERRMLNELRRR